MSPSGLIFIISKSVIINYWYGERDKIIVNFNYFINGINCYLFIGNGKFDGFFKSNAITAELVLNPFIIENILKYNIAWLLHKVGWTVVSQ